MSLREKVEGMNKGKGIEFMDGRAKGETSNLIDKEITINDYSFLKGDDREYLVFVVVEYPQLFFFGGTVLTEKFKVFDNNDREEIINEGLPAKIVQRKNRKGNREYQDIVFYPNIQRSEVNLPF